MKIAFSSIALAAAPLFALGCTPAADGDGQPEPTPTPQACELRDDCGEEEGRPGRRSEAQAAYDPEGERLVVFGGVSIIPFNCEFTAPGTDDFLPETWAFHDGCGIWKQIGGTQPPARSRHMMAYDPGEKRILLFGGRFRSATNGNYTLYNDLWQLDLATDTWTQITTQGTPPSARVVW